MSGATYRTATASGITGPEGDFRYLAGEAVEFSVGPVRLGRATPGIHVTPLDLIANPSGHTDPRVTAMASFLQTADRDADLGNGIQVVPALADRLCAELNVTAFDFTTLNDLAAFETALQNAALAEHLSYVDSATAGANLTANLMALMEQVTAYDPAWGTAGAFTAASNCSRCHAARSGEAAMRLPMGDVTGEDISPYTEWKHSMMAHSFDDPYFQAVLQEEATHEFPAFAGLIEDRCLTCHAPMGRTSAHSSNTGLDANGDYRYSRAVVDQQAREGVSCTLCHQIASTTIDDEGQPVVGEDSFSGKYTIGDARIIYGPYSGINAGPMQNQVNYTPRYGHQVTDSGHCGSCHTVRTPVMDANTAAPLDPPRQFLEQAPYQEWQNSVYSRGAENDAKRTCQDCHMPAVEDYQTPISTRPAGQVDRAPYHRHRLFGGNTHMLETLKVYRTVLGIDSSTSLAGFDEKIAATREFLGQRSAALGIPRLAAVAGTLELDVQVTNLTGHKLPSAYPSRRMWLHVKITDGAGAIVFESGAPGADGRLSIDSAAEQAHCIASRKPVGFVNDGCFEPHRDRITDPSQVAVYESVLGDSNGNITYVLLYADRYLKDDRIPPRGFRQRAAIKGTEIVLGGVADSDFNTEGADGGSGSDQVHYRIPTRTTGGPYQVTVQLLYQSIRPGFVAGLHADGARVERFRTMYKMLPPPAEELASVVRTAN
ncbi:MAG: hypothetical protein P8180_09755 [Gammaproteobacteria bacterium]